MSEQSDPKSPTPWNALTDQQRFAASFAEPYVSRKRVYDLSIELEQVARQREVDRLELVRIAGQMRRAAGFR